MQSSCSLRSWALCLVKNLHHSLMVHVQLPRQGCCQADAPRTPAKTLSSRNPLPRNPTNPSFLNLYPSSTSPHTTSPFPFSSTPHSTHSFTHQQPPHPPNTLTTPSPTSPTMSNLEQEAMQDLSGGGDGNQSQQGGGGGGGGGGGASSGIDKTIDQGIYIHPIPSPSLPFPPLPHPFPKAPTKQL